MATPSRRRFIGLGLAAGSAALALQATRADTDSDEARELRFRLAQDYRPDTSRKARRRLTRATLDFLFESHPPGMTLSIWEREPRDLPFLEAHLDRIVDSVCDGVDDSLSRYPVDPVLVVAVLYNESRFYPGALSPAGALGMAQFMPDTALEYGLGPIGRPDLWQIYRETRTAERARRAAQRRAFVAKFRLPAFSPEAVIERALETGSMEVLGAWQAIQQESPRESVALDVYLDAVREELDAGDFFADKGRRLSRFDARIGYDAAGTAAAFLANVLAANAGMASSAIAAYNAGPSAVKSDNPRSVLHEFGELPAFPETVRYVQRIMAVYTRLSESLA